MTGVEQRASRHVPTLRARWRLPSGERKMARLLTWLSAVVIALPMAAIATPTQLQERWDIRQLIGRPVVDRIGNAVGKVSDVVIGSDQRLQSMVIALPGGDSAPSLVEVPWRIASWGLSGDSVSLPLDAQDVRALNREVDRFQAPTASQWLGRDLIGTGVRDGDRGLIGTVRSVVVNVGGYVDYYVVARGEQSDITIPVQGAKLNARLGVVELAEQPR